MTIEIFSESGFPDPSQSILTCGFSCIAIIFLIAVVGIILLAGVACGLRRYQGGIPLVGSCSAAISAACHPPDDELDVAFKPVRWGVVSEGKGIGHCALSGRKVGRLIKGKFYLGNREDV